MTEGTRVNHLHTLLRQVRMRRLLVMLFAALVAGFLTDWFRHDRVFFPNPLPEFKTVSAEK
jgi:hypothetical protein